MKSAFEILGIESRLVIDEESLRAAFREAGKAAHPDAGGGDGEFSKLRAAFELLSSRSRRLRHWLELRGNPVETRGAVDSKVMDMFSEVAATTQRAETIIRKRDETKSALGLALLERETHACREAVEQRIALVEAEIVRECSGFSEIETSAEVDMESVSRIARNLAFLEKWRAGLRGVFSRLI